MKEGIREKLKKAALFLLNPRLILCMGVAWIITNGWSYILMGLGAYLHIPWMTTVAGAYLAFLRLPFTPEKLVTVAIALALLRWLFPNDTKTLAVLKQLLEKARASRRQKKPQKSKPKPSTKKESPLQERREQ